MPNKSSKKAPSSIATAAKASKKAGKAVAKPAVPANAAARSERQALTDTARVTARKLYSGSSLVVHAHRAPKLADCIARIKNPVMPANSATVRDQSLLLLIAGTTGFKAGSFDPTAPGLNCDLGVISRLASLSFLSAPGDKPTLTERGAEYARAARKSA